MVVMTERKRTQRIIPTHFTLLTHTHTRTGIPCKADSGSQAGSEDRTVKPCTPWADRKKKRERERKRRREHVRVLTWAQNNTHIAAPSCNVHTGVW